MDDWNPYRLTATECIEAARAGVSPRRRTLVNGRLRPVGVFQLNTAPLRSELVSIEAKCFVRVLCNYVRLCSHTNLLALAKVLYELRERLPKGRRSLADKLCLCHVAQRLHNETDPVQRDRLCEAISCILRAEPELVEVARKLTAA